MTTEEQAFYTAHSGGYQSQAHTRGPWSVDHQHAGPPCALLARAIEQTLPADTPMHVARLTFEILRPVPIAQLQVETSDVHSGRKLRVTEATLYSDSAKPLIRARAVVMACSEVDTPPEPDHFETPAAPDQSPPFEFDFFAADQGYHKAMEMRMAQAASATNSVAMWVRMRLPLVAGEAPTPLQRVVVAADSGNGVSCTLDVTRYTFINPDLTVYLHRAARGEWVCLQAQTLTQTHGVGLADTRLYDSEGAIGRSDQSLIIQRR